MFFKGWLNQRLVERKMSKNPRINGGANHLANGAPLLFSDFHSILKLGVSIYFKLSQDGIIETKAAVKETHKLAPRAAMAKIMIGQCHKYHEYETLPSRVKIPEFNGENNVPACSFPARMIRSVPSTGRATTSPGNTVSSEIDKAAMRIMVIPRTETIDASLLPDMTHPVTANRDPRPNSHARVIGL
jgi:hypothetical protein